MPDHAAIRRTRQLSLVLYFVLAAVLVLAGYLSYSSYANELHAEVSSQLKAVASLKATAVEVWHEEQLGDVTLLSGNASFRRLLDEALSSDAGATRELDDWLSGVRHAGNHGSALIVDAHGAIKLAQPAESATLPPDLLSDISEAVLTGKAAVAEFYRDQEDHIYLATIAPVPSESSSETVAALVLVSDPADSLYPYIQEWPGDAETAETLLVTKDGSDALFLNELKYQKNTALKLRIPLSKTDVPAVQAALGFEGVMNGVDYKGAAVVAATKGIPGTPWAVVARIDESEVYAPVRARLSLIIGLVAGALVTGLLGMLLVLRLQASRIYREQYEAEAERSWLSGAIDDSLNEVYAFDADTLHFTYVNRGALRNTGYTMDELTGMTPVDIKPEYTNESFRAAMEPILSGDRDLLVFETVHLRKDGTEYPVLVHLQLTTRVGQRLFLAMISDITKRRAAEAELAVHRENLELLVVQRTEQLQDANEELAATNEELAAGNEELFAANDEVAAVNEELAATNEELESSNEELAAANEELASSNEEMQTLYEEAAEASNELERLNRELELAGAAKSDFLASMSHELRTPLNSVIGFSDIMLQGMAGELNEEQHRQMEMINSSGKHLLLLINDVLDLSKVEAGRMEPEPEPFDLCGVVHEALDAVRPQAERSGLALVADGTGVSCDVVSDARMVKQILLNLLSNAIKFTETGAVSVTVVESDSSVAIAVGDTGPGIAANDLKRIFEAFTQVRVHDHRPDGTGLGLTVSSKLAALLGGELSVVSARGDGSTFTFTLPKAWTPPIAS